ncbi:hypothetical protein CCP4SC76_1710004 [Gammaproteobacteria bacterium]
MLALGVSPDRVSFGNTIKKARHVREAFDKGVRLFATDSEADVRQLAQAAPGSRVFFRLLMDAVTSDSDWPLSKKFGCQPAEIVPWHSHRPMAAGHVYFDSPSRPMPLHTSHPGPSDVHLAPSPAWSA